MEQFVAWLANLPPALVYAVIALASFFENVLPPTPSDVAVALAGFITRQGHIDAERLWFVAWSTNMAGTVVVYLLARRFGRGFLASRLGQRLLPADTIVSMERGYLRYGVAGIFIGRFLPGIRSFVTPFVGLIRLSPLRALLPMAAASAIWYALLVWAGARIGEEWDAIRSFVHHLNTTLGIVALVVVAAFGAWLWRRAQRVGPLRRRLFRLIARAIGPGPGEEGTVGEGDDLAARAAATLLYALANADPALTLEERSLISDYLRTSWRLEDEGTGEEGELGAAIGDAERLGPLVASRFRRERRVALAERLYRIALADGILSSHEQRLMRRAGDLLGLAGEDLAEARKRVGA